MLLSMLDNYVQNKCPYHSIHKFCSIPFSILPFCPPESLEYSKNFRPICRNILLYTQPHHQPLPTSGSIVSDRYPHILLKKGMCQNYRCTISEIIDFPSK